MYECHSKPAAVEMIKTMSHTSDFLNAIQCQSLIEAGALTRECILVLESNVDSIKEKKWKFNKKGKRSGGQYI